jgi:hypothetical protein
MSLESHLKGFSVKTLSFLGFLAVALTATAGGIRIGTSLIFGDGSRIVRRQESRRTDLSPEQLQGLA